MTPVLEATGVEKRYEGGVAALRDVSLTIDRGELVEHGARRLVAAQPGAFADGWVEVRGRGLRRGAVVVVPA